jgi:uncharacterized protein YegL
MPYSAEISRRNPSCIMFLLDQSGSMDEEFGKEKGVTKAQGATNAINRILRAIIDRCTKDEGVRDYFDISIIGYGSKENFADSLFRDKFVKVSWLDEHPLRLEEKIEKTPKGDEVRVKFPIWFEPVAYNGTPMCKALQLAYEWLKEWISKHNNAFPPLVFNITDGEATDGEPEPFGRKVMELSTADGNVLLFNCHISSTEAKPILFPAEISELPADEFAQLLFRMSSELPEPMLKLAQLKKGSRGFAFNADLADLIRFLDIGTRPAFGQMK